ncbi:hypothetical protein HYH03_018507, partial [Edaphochlamys debaryana]
MKARAMRRLRLALLVLATALASCRAALPFQGFGSAPNITGFGSSSGPQVVINATSIVVYGNGQDVFDPSALPGTGNERLYDTVKHIGFHGVVLPAQGLPSNWTAFAALRSLTIDCAPTPGRGGAPQRGLAAGALLAARAGDLVGGATASGSNASTGSTGPGSNASTGSSSGNGSSNGSSNSSSGGVEGGSSGDSSGSGSNATGVLFGSDVQLESVRQFVLFKENVSVHAVSIVNCGMRGVYSSVWATYFSGVQLVNLSGNALAGDFTSIDDFGDVCTPDFAGDDYADPDCASTSLHTLDVSRNALAGDISTGAALGDDVTDAICSTGCLSLVLEPGVAAPEVLCTAPLVVYAAVRG